MIGVMTNYTGKLVVSALYRAPDIPGEGFHPHRRLAGYPAIGEPAPTCPLAFFPSVASFPHTKLVAGAMVVVVAAVVAAAMPLAGHRRLGGGGGGGFVSGGSGGWSSSSS
jgi:hypothetical protein